MFVLPRNGRANLSLRLLKRSLAGRFWLPADGVGEVRKAEARVEDCHGKDREDDHGTLQSDELGLVPHELGPPAPGKFRNAVDTASEDAKKGDANANYEQSEFGVVKQSERLSRELIDPTVSADRVFGCERGEDHKDNYLKYYASYHEVGPRVESGGPWVRGSGKSASSSLENEREQVAGDEDVCVPGGSKPRPRFAKSEHKVLEREVYAGGEECGSEDETANLQLEPLDAVGIEVHHDAADVAGHFSATTETHGNHIRPCFVAYAKYEIEEEGEAEESNEKCVCREGGVIAVDGTLNRANVSNLGAEIGRGRRDVAGSHDVSWVNLQGRDTKRDWATGTDGVVDRGEHKAASKPGCCDAGVVQMD